VNAHLKKIIFLFIAWGGNLGMGMGMGMGIKKTKGGKSVHKSEKNKVIYREKSHRENDSV